jgi:hypothetical protein
MNFYTMYRGKIEGNQADLLVLASHHQFYETVNIDPLQTRK